MKRKSWSDEVSQSHLSLSKRGQLGTGVNCSYYSLCCLKTFGTQSTFINQNPKLNETKQRCSVKPERATKRHLPTEKWTICIYAVASLLLWREVWLACLQEQALHTMLNYNFLFWKMYLISTQLFHLLIEEVWQKQMNRPRPEMHCTQKRNDK